MERIVDIGTEGLHLSAYRGFLIVTKDRAEIGRVALDDVHAVILHAHGCSWTGNLVAALAERGAPIVFCGTNHSDPALLAKAETGLAVQKSQANSNNPAERRPVPRRLAVQKSNANSNTGVERGTTRGAGGSGQSAGGLTQR